MARTFLGALEKGKGEHDMKNAQNESPIGVLSLFRHPTVDFAAQELNKYLGIMSSAEEEAGSCEFKLGLHRQFNVSTDGLEKPDLDDAIYINVRSGCGIISGSNARSVLLAVYRYLEEIGCRWARPGVTGEYVPKADWRTKSVKVNEAASYRHRGICIEGAVSLENMLENIDWAPKAGFNAYFLEFKTPFTFFDRWYSHRHNKYKQPEPVSVEQVVEFTAELEKEIKKRGLLYHAVGHGLTCEPFGLPGLGWDPVDLRVDAETSQYFASVNGKRELWGGVPLNTNLCFSNPEARRMMVNYATNYLVEKPHVDFLHFWLADGFNNHCECEGCRDILPSDLYILLLNELDEELSRRAINTRIVFLLYLDLLWAPAEERLTNPERFVLLFAPISRTYSTTYDTDLAGIQLRPYVRNQLTFPANIRENYAFLETWRQWYKGDSFAYEYHFMWDHYYDPGYYKMAQILSSDIKNLKSLRLNGMISDQTQRSFFPTGLGMYVMGKLLWNDSLEFEALASDYFALAFGADGKLCMNYMEELSECFDPPYLRGEKPEISEEAANRLAQVREAIREFKPVIERNRGRHDPCRNQSWEYVHYHADLANGLSLALEARAKGQSESASEQWRIVSDWVQRNEDLYQPVFDVFLFIQTWNKLFDFKQKRTAMFGGEVS
jgi:hypothetical protein